VDAPDTAPIREDSATLADSKRVVLKELISSTTLENFIGRIGELIRESGDKSYAEILGDLVADRSKISETGHKASASRRSLRRILLGNRNVNAFVCILCDASFIANGDLKDHYRYHLDLDDFKCVYCESYFRTSGSLKRHITATKICRDLQAASRLRNPVEAIIGDPS